MKKLLIMLFFSHLLLSPLYSKACDITIQSLWKNLETPRETKLFGSQWILAGIITFKRTPEIKDPIFINNLHFAWNGPKLESLSASLYKKSGYKFIPVEEALVSDGKWNSITQELHFKFNEEERLDPVSKFYIVITIPDNITTNVQSGTFTLVQDCLPEELQEDTYKKLNDIDPNIPVAMISNLSFTVRPNNSFTRSNRG